MAVRMPWASRPSALAVSLLALPLALLASCGPKTAVEQPFIANIPAPLPDNIPFLEVPPPAPVLINQSKGEDLWHLRSGLNVAVLLCQDANNAAMVAAYNRLLTTHKGLLSSAAQTEVDLYRSKGGKKWQDAYDDHMTKIYNAYSGTLTRDAFCARSRAILDEAGAATPELFSEHATVMLWDLNKAAGLPDPDGRLARAAALAQTGSAAPLVQTSQVTPRP
ncbi:MAG TPA: hypothetical protein VNS79_01170 [Sphingobium sp.]|nr:hypothetical protein [Sphingobium sp.]